MDLNKLAADLSGLATDDVNALGDILKNDYNSAVKVVHDDLLGTGTSGDAAAAIPPAGEANSGGDPTGPGTGPGH